MKIAMCSRRLGAVSCGLQQGAEVELKNASGNEVAAAVKQSGVMYEQHDDAARRLWS